MSELTFEDYRDRYFVNPKTRDPGYLPEALSYAAQELLGSGCHQDLVPTPQKSEHKELAFFVSELVRDFAGARRFDHLSVAQLHPSDNIPAMIGHMVSTMRNNNTIVEEVSAVETRYEREGIAWMQEHIARFGTENPSGSIVSGGTSANTTALLIARELLSNSGWDGKTEATIFTNTMAHYSIMKAAVKLAPRGIIKIEKIPLKQRELKVDTDKLALAVREHRRARRPILAIVGVAGETETGLVEDLDAIVTIGKEAGVFVHIDGAYGAPFVLSSRRALFDGMQDADSIACDPHKYLYTPYGAGAVLFRNQLQHEILMNLNTDGIDYMFGKFGNNLGERRMEGSMGGQAAAALHAVIHTLGAAGIGKILDHGIEVTQHFADCINALPNLKTAYNPELNTVCVMPKTKNGCYPDQAVFTETSRLLQESGVGEHGIYLSQTAIPMPHHRAASQKRLVFRFVGSHPYTDKSDVETIACELKTNFDYALRTKGK